MSALTDTFADRAAQWDSPEKIKMTQRFVDELQQHISIQKNWKALEIGAGTGLVGLQLLPHVESMVFEDTSAAMLEVLQQKLEPKQQAEIFLGEITALQESNFDLVVSCMAFHHIPNIDETILHLYQLCNSGAYVLISDLGEEDGSFHNFEPIPHKGFDFNSLEQLFRKAGFSTASSKAYNQIKKKNANNELRCFDQYILIAQK